jgi:hypothetical protein
MVKEVTLEQENMLKAKRGICHAKVLWYYE